MRCRFCRHDNPSGSRFCERCGRRLSNSGSNPKSSRSISDVVFVPKKSTFSWGRVIGTIFAVIVIFFVFLIYFFGGDTSSNQTGDQNTQTQNNYLSTYELGNLQLMDQKMLGNSYGVPNPTYEATLYNSGSIPVKNVILKINFYKNNVTNTNEPPQDTQYINATTYLGPGDSIRLNGTVSTAFNTSGNFKWFAEVYSAER